MSYKGLQKEIRKLKLPKIATGGNSPCGVCDSCYFRARAFKELGMVDPYFTRSEDRRQKSEVR